MAFWWWVMCTYWSGRASCCSAGLVHKPLSTFVVGHWKRAKWKPHVSGTATQRYHSQGKKREGAFHALSWEKEREKKDSMTRKITLLIWSNNPTVSEYEELFIQSQLIRIFLQLKIEYSKFYRFEKVTRLWILGICLEKNFCFCHLQGFS